MRPLLAAALLAPAILAATPEESFEMNVRPLLAKNCFGCHTQTKMGGLAMTSRDALLTGGKSGPSIIPGNPDQSLLYQVVAHTHDRVKMPPAGKLANAEIATIAEWIKDGAVWPEAKKVAETAGKYVITPEQRQWWAFRPIQKPAPPKVKNAAWAKSPVDSFILARLEADGLTPSGPADRRTLLRRVTFDLTGLPPTPAEVEAFLADKSPNAFSKVVDRLLASPQYGERWGRHWMDVARYSDDKMESQRELPHPNAFRYRDWIIKAFNDDMPYDEFVKAQIAGDLMPTPEKYAPGLAFYALSPEQQDDRVDATTRGFLALTVACAQCHDHKFDPIPQRDFYALQGVFDNAKASERPLAAPDVVKAWEDHKKKLDDKKAELSKWQEQQATILAEILAAKTARYLTAAIQIGDTPSLDSETIGRWREYLKLAPEKYSHDFLKPWQDARKNMGDLKKVAAEFQTTLLAVQAEKKDIDQQNLIRLGGSNARRDLSNADLVSLPRDKFYLWEQTFGPRGLLYYSGEKLDRWLSVPFKSHLDSLRAEAAELEKSLPEKYPFLHALEEPKQPKNTKLAIRGSRDNLGPEIPRGFVSILSAGEPLAFKNGSGRLELAESIANKENPLFARVIANRIWHWHFGRGIVATPSNFGQLGEKPTHPELLDWLSARLIENKFSLKALHRDILLSSAYQQAWTRNAANEQKDPANALLWRAPRQRLDVEAMRDAMLAVAGNLDLTAGGPPPRLTDEKNLRRTVYGYRSRRKQDTTLALFDHPVPVTSVEQRLSTTVPLQRLYFLNNDFVMRQANEFAKSLAGPDDTTKIRDAYRRLYAREASKDEITLGLEFLAGDSARWPQYAQVLLASNEFLWVN